MNSYLHNILLIDRPGSRAAMSDPSPDATYNVYFDGSRQNLRGRSMQPRKECLADKVSQTIIAGRKYPTKFAMSSNFLIFCVLFVSALFLVSRSVPSP